MLSELLNLQHTNISIHVLHMLSSQYLRHWQEELIDSQEILLQNGDLSL